MRLANFPELQRLPRRTRLKIAEELWDSAAGDDLPVPATHKKLIRDRRAAYQALLAHPLGPASDQVPAVLDDMLTTHRAFLPQFVA